MTDSKIVPFGKYKDQPVETLLADSDYLQWLLTQDWFRTRYVNLYQTVINYGAEPTETPEHNALQVLFLDDAFCLAFVRHIEPKIALIARKMLEQDRQTRCKQLRDGGYGYRGLVHYCEQIERHEKKGKLENWQREELNDARAKAAELQTKLDALTGDLGKITIVFARSLERRLESSLSHRHHGPIDVQLTVYFVAELEEQHSLPWNSRHGAPDFLIELKPTVSDDYPAVPRQMRANGATILLLREYTGRGATREQFVATFNNSGIRVVFQDDIAR
jgi:hypothetical protein